MIDLAYLEKRKAELQAGLDQLREQFKQAIYIQQGAISLIDEQIAELSKPVKDKAEVKRKVKAAKRAALVGARVAEPAVNGKETPEGAAVA